MIKIVLRDGDAFEGETWEAIVDSMRDSTPLVPDPDNAEYMRNVAHRCKVVNGSVIDTSTEEAFIQSLHQAGFVTKIREEN